MSFPLKIKIPAIVLLLSLSSSLAAGTKYTIELNGNPEETQKKLEETLGKNKIPFKKPIETKGFSYRTQVGFFNPFAMDIYVGQFNDKTVLRIDSPYNRLSRAFAEVMLQESGQQQFPVTYKPKSMFIAIPLTIISPAFGSWYTYAGSPLKPVNFWIVPLTHFLVDLGLLFIGGKTFFVHGFDPLNRGLIATSILMGGHRLAHIFLNVSAISAHNQMVTMGYTFRY